MLLCSFFRMCKHYRCTQTAGLTVCLFCPNPRRSLHTPPPPPLDPPHPPATLDPNPPLSLCTTETELTGHEPKCILYRIKCAMTKRTLDDLFFLCFLKESQVVTCKEKSCNGNKNLAVCKLFKNKLFILKLLENMFVVVLFMPLEFFLF